MSRRGITFSAVCSLYEQANRPYGRAEALNAIGNSYRRQGNYAHALYYLRQGLKLLEESGRKFGLAGALTEMGDLYLLQGDENLALEFYHRSQTLFEELGSKDNTRCADCASRNTPTAAQQLRAGPGCLSAEPGTIQVNW